MSERQRIDEGVQKMRKKLREGVPADTTLITRGKFSKSEVVAIKKIAKELNKLTKKGKQDIHLVIQPALKSNVKGELYVSVTRSPDIEYTNDSKLMEKRCSASIAKSDCWTFWISKEEN